MRSSKPSPRFRAKFLLDVNVPVSVRNTLRNRGYDAIRLSELISPRARNSEVAKLAIVKKRIIITLDSDFFVLRRELQQKAKIVFIEVHPRDPVRITKLVESYIQDCVNALKRKNLITLTDRGLSEFL